jgi:HK97 family phage prohead protease
MQTKHVSALLEKATSSDFDARFIMSAATPDRVADTIEPAAYDKAIPENGKLIALFNHDPDKIVGYWADIKRVGDTLVGQIKFASTSLGQMLKTLMADGVPLSSSIGFRGKGAANKAGGIHFSQIELLETSIVATPAHPRAVQIAKSFGVNLSSNTDDRRLVASDRQASAMDRARSAVLTANRSIRK